MFNRHDEDRERRWDRDREERDRSEYRTQDRGRWDRDYTGERGRSFNQDRGYEDRGYEDRDRDWERDRDYSREREGYRGSYGQTSGGYAQYDRGASSSEGGYTGPSGYRRSNYMGQGGYGGYSSVHDRQTSWAGPGSRSGWNQGGTGGWERAGSQSSEWDRGTATSASGSPTRFDEWRENAGAQSWGGYGGSYAGGMGTYSGQGRHYGKGPKGYQRSDERIREDVNEQLYRHPDIDASEIEVQVQQAEVTLTGTVDERHIKRLAEDVAENVPGVRQVHNHLRVKSGILGSVFGSNEETKSTTTKTR
jgi:osmotically-inducible protein OsmY